MAVGEQDKQGSTTVKHIRIQNQTEHYTKWWTMYINLSNTNSVKYPNTNLTRSLFTV